MCDSFIPCNDDIPYELQAVCRFVKPKQDRRTYHMLKDARNLPCGHTACYNCIVNAIINNGGYIECNFEGPDHQIQCTAIHIMSLKDADDLPKNKVYKHVIDENYQKIGKFIHENFKRKVIEIGDSDKCSQFENIINYSEEELLIRSESLKKDIENYVNQAMTLYSLLEKCKILSKTLKKRIKTNENHHETESKELKRVKSKISLIKKVQHDVSSSISHNDLVVNIDTKKFGSLHLIDHSRLQTVAPRTLQVRTYMADIRNICEINSEKIAIYGGLQNQNKDRINLFDKRFLLLEQKQDIDVICENGERFKEQLSTIIKLCSDKYENVFVLLQNKILKCDINLSVCTRVIKLKNCLPVDIQYQNKLIYLLNKRLCCVEIFQEDAITPSKIDLKYNNEEIDEPMYILVNQDRLIVYSNLRNIFVYKLVDFDAVHLQTIPSRDTIMCLAENCIFTLNVEFKRLTCYTPQNLLQHNVNYVQSYQRSFDYLDTKRGFMIYMEENLLIALEQFSTFLII